MKIDLNCDAGETLRHYQPGGNADITPQINLINMG